MRIGVFTYSFPHFKTQQYLLSLMASGNRPEVIFAQDRKELDFYESKVRVVPRHLCVHNIRTMGELFGIYVLNLDHDSSAAVDIIKGKGLDLGIILGARVLKKHTINAFNMGILNIHPGLIPENRGLDNLKWAVIDHIKQGVTTHLIDEHVDRGLVIDRQPVDVYPDDTFVDIALRLYEKGQQMMVEAIDKIKSGMSFVGPQTEGKYNRSVPPEVEATLEARFEYYKRHYDSIG